MNPKNKMSKKKKIIIALLIILSPIELLILFIVFVNIYYPVSEYFDHQKFTALDTESRKIYEQLAAVSPGEDKWEYKTGCAIELTGPWSTGRYDCVTASILEKIVSDINEINNLNEKYSSIIDLNKQLAPNGNIYNNNIFKNNFIVADTSRSYRELKTNVICEYTLQLDQSRKDLANSENENGRNIVGNGIATVSVECRDKAERSWYPTIESISTVPADFTLSPDDGESEFFRLF